MQSGQIEQIVVRRLKRTQCKIRTDERPDTVTRLDQPGQLEAGDRLSHDIAADTKLRAEFLFGGEPLAGREALIEDTRAQLLR